jgi:hypothetical protein
MPGPEAEAAVTRVARPNSNLHLLPLLSGFSRVQRRTPQAAVGCARGRDRKEVFPMRDQRSCPELNLMLEKLLEQ